MSPLCAILCYGLLFLLGVVVIMPLVVIGLCYVKAGLAYAIVALEYIHKRLEDLV